MGRIDLDNARVRRDRALTACCAAAVAEADRDGDAQQRAARLMDCLGVLRSVHPPASAAGLTMGTLRHGLRAGLGALLPPGLPRLGASRAVPAAHPCRHPNGPGPPPVPANNRLERGRRRKLSRGQCHCQPAIQQVIPGYSTCPSSSNRTCSSARTPASERLRRSPTARAATRAPHWSASSAPPAR